MFSSRHTYPNGILQEGSLFNCYTVQTFASCISVTHAVFPSLAIVASVCLRKASSLNLDALICHLINHAVELTTDALNLSVPL